MRKEINRSVFLFGLLIFFLNLLSAQNLEHIDPPFWWAGMHNSELQLMVHGEDIGSLIAVSKDENLQVLATHKADSPNYIFIDLDISECVAGNYRIDLVNKGERVHTFSYILRSREAGSAEREGINSSDAVYLITPDRFANGDPTNDEVEGLQEGVARDLEYGRHGGDLKGIEDHLDYIDEMGFTAIWLNPVLINDQHEWSYHGYATTDYYKVDPRFGSNEEYAALAKKATDQGVGLIMDIIVNHCGSHHWWMKDLPFKDWLNNPGVEYVETNHRKETLLDPYRSDVDRKIMTEGWFVPAMPDLNQRNKFMSTYLIQNSIWWIECAHLAAIRQDTYSYPFREFMTDWTCAIMDEYPNFYIVGEEWIDDASMIAYWQEGKVNQDGYTSCLPGLMDFPLCFALPKALNEEETWSDGLIKIYQSLSRDHVYADPSQLVVFPDNHDMKRIFVELEEDVDKFKMAMTFYLTTRGVPQLYYGTEILMNTGKDGSHGYIRSDFPGGWVGDSISVREDVGLSKEQQEGKAFCSKLLNWRKDKTVIHEGKLMHYIPIDGVYVYFRYDEDESVMIILNKNKELYELDLSRFAERLDGYKIGVDVNSNNKFALDASLKLEPMNGYIIELK